MPPERAFSSVIQLFAVHVEAEAAPDGQRIAPLNGDGQALAQEVSLTHIPRDPRDQPTQLHHEYPGLLPPSPQGLECERDEHVRAGEGGILDHFRRLCLGRRCARTPRRGLKMGMGESVGMPSHPKPDSDRGPMAELRRHLVVDHWRGRGRWAP